MSKVWVSRNILRLEVYALYFGGFCSSNEHIDEENRITLQLRKSSPFLSELISFNSRFTIRFYLSFTGKTHNWELKFLILERESPFFRRDQREFRGREYLLRRISSLPLLGRRAVKRATTNRHSASWRTC